MPWSERCQPFRLGRWLLVFTLKGWEHSDQGIALVSSGIALVSSGIALVFWRVIALVFWVIALGVWAALCLPVPPQGPHQWPRRSMRL